MSLEEVRGRIESAARRAGRVPADITLVVVGKGHGLAELEELHRQGVRDFGESRAQDLAAKVDGLPADVRWHFVGPLQTNKVRIVRPAVSLLHSLDRVSLGEVWVKGAGLPPPALLQVNVGGEAQKLGVPPDESHAVLDRLARIGVEVVGLMTVPPQVGDPEDARPFFASLFELRRQLSARHADVRHLSMGMSDDYEVAVEEGATLVRVGRAIFAGSHS